MNITDIIRRLENVIRLGTVTQVDHGKARCRVQSGGITTGWLPWLAQRAGETRTWCPPTEGEQVLVVAPGGELTQAVVFSGLFSDANPANSSLAKVHRTDYPDGAIVEYDSNTHHLHAVLPAGTARIEASHVTITGSVTVEGSVRVLGTVAAAGDVIAVDSISLSGHKHTEVVPGVGVSGGPI